MYKPRHCVHLHTSLSALSYSPVLGQVEIATEPPTTSRNLGMQDNVEILWRSREIVEGCNLDLSQNRRVAERGQGSMEMYTVPGFVHI